MSHTKQTTRKVWESLDRSSSINVRVVSVRVSDSGLYAHSGHLDIRSGPAKYSVRAGAGPVGFIHAADAFRFALAHLQSPEYIGQLIAR